MGGSYETQIYMYCDCHITYSGTDERSVIEGEKVPIAYSCVLLLRAHQKKQHVAMRNSISLVTSR